jgi:hypothetical protein
MIGTFGCTDIEIMNLQYLIIDHFNFFAVNDSLNNSLNSENIILIKIQNSSLNVSNSSIFVQNHSLFIENTNINLNDTAFYA